MKKKIITAGFLSAILIIVIFTSIGTSINLKPQNETQTDIDLITSLENILADSEDITIDQLFAADLLIQEKILLKIADEYQLTAEENEMPLDPPICHLLRNYIQHCRESADDWREKANWYPDDNHWVTICNIIANWYDSKADQAEIIYNALGCD